jgi:hypothetical protein
MLEFFQKIIDVLNKCNIPYMLSGSVAMSLYIVPRATRDFDFIIHLRPDDADEFAKNFTYGYYCDLDSMKDAIENKGMFNIIDHSSGFKADFVILKNSDFRQTEFSRRTQVNFYDKPIFVVTPEDLLLSKLIWIQEYQSPLQIEDIKQLASIASIDWEYIGKWTRSLKLSTFGLISI